LFYEIVNTNASGRPGNKGDVHYRCLHGLHKICTITQGMNGNLHCNVSFLPIILLINFMRYSGLKNHLRVHIAPMYQLYCVLNGRPEPPTAEDIAIASGKKPLSEKAQAEYIKKLESASENIKRAFQEQEARAAVSVCVVDTIIFVSQISVL
jgi:hypothetical protein